MRYLKTILLVGLISTIGWAQKKDQAAIKYANTLTKADLKKHLVIVAADDMEGRDTGSPGQKKAAKYIANHFKSLGLKPPVKTKDGMSYLQKFDLMSSKWKDVSIATKRNKTEYLKATCSPPSIL